MYLDKYNKLFPADKNYILKEAQIALKASLLDYTVDFAKSAYLRYFNPLGLEDDTILKIKAHQSSSNEHLEDFYVHLAGIFRYKYGDNQLEFLFDGTDHYDKYEQDWDSTYKAWLENFAPQLHFLKAVLEATVFYPKDRKAALACNRMKAFITQQFDLKLYRYKGIVAMKIA